MCSCSPGERRTAAAFSSRARRRLVAGAAASCAVALACQASPDERLEGRWLGSRFESLDGSVSAARAGWAKGTALEFSGARISIRLPAERARHGTYRVVADRDGQLELAVTGHDGHVDRTELTLETDELLRWHLTPVHTLVLRRD